MTRFASDLVDPRQTRDLRVSPIGTEEDSAGQSGEVEGMSRCETNNGTNTAGGFDEAH